MQYFLRLFSVLLVACSFCVQSFASVLLGEGTSSFQYPEDRFEEALLAGNAFNARGIMAMPNYEERVYVAELYARKLAQLVEEGYERFDNAPCEPSGERLAIADDMLLSAYFYSYAAWRYLADDSINYEHLTRGANNIATERVGFLDGMLVGFTLARNIYLDNCEHGPATHSDNAARLVEEYERWIECLDIGTHCSFHGEDPQTEENLIVLEGVLNLVTDHALIALWLTGRHQDLVAAVLSHLSPEELERSIEARRIALMGEDDDDYVHDEL